MNMKKIATSGVAAGAIAVALSGFATDNANANANMANKNKEKCYGIVKAGKNDCGDAHGKHSCMGQASKDADGGDWIALPKGACDRITGGSTKPKA